MDEYLAALDQELRELVASPDPAYDGYYGMFSYHLGWMDSALREIHSVTGKRIRPLLCMLSCEACGGDWHSALPIAAAIELTHNFSLIHDDIEDNSDERHGRAAVWKVWGLPQGLNAGDGMFVLARLALDRLCRRGLEMSTCTDISLIFDAATLYLCHGQYLDLGFESRDEVTVDEYMQMIRGKTAALISASTHIGAMISTPNQSIVDAFSRFGETIGIAFQITDDILGVWGDPQVTGKSTASDILSKKKSLPTIIGLQRSEEMRVLYRKDNLAPHIPRILEILNRVGARDYAQQQADEFRSAALAALDSTRLENLGIDHLREIAAAMTRRQR